MYRGDKSHVYEAFGLSEDDIDPIQILPENVKAFELFSFMSTQWRYSFGGATGLDYSVLPVAFRTLDISEDEQPQIFRDLKIMESAALAEIHKSNK